MTISVNVIRGRIKTFHLDGRTTTQVQKDGNLRRPTNLKKRTRMRLYPKAGKISSQIAKEACLKEQKKKGSIIT